MDFDELVDAAEDAESTLGAVASLLVDELFQDGRSEPLFTRRAMTLKRVYDMRLKQAEQLASQIEQWGRVATC